MDHKKLESMFHKKHAPHIHAHHSWHTPHVHHDHTHAHMYARVYTCTHCSRKGHLTKFYFNRLNISKFANRNIWVSIAINTHELKKLWVSKFSPLVFDVGVGSYKHDKNHLERG